MKAEFDVNNFLLRLPLPKWMLKLIFQVPEWKTDYDAALAQAKQDNKVVFALFTGSDWCTACKNLHAEVLTSGLFMSWADKKVVLLKIDFPMHSQLPPALVKQNQMLLNKYNVNGYPEAIGLDPDGSERGRYGGYTKGTGPKPWLIAFETNAKMNKSPAP